MNIFDWDRNEEQNMNNSEFKFMKKIKGVVLDRDGTIIKHIHYLGDPSLVELNIDIKYF